MTRHPVWNGFDYDMQEEVVMTDLPNLTKLFEQATERPYTIAGFAGEHEEHGAAIEADDRIIASTEPVRVVHSARNWREYHATPKLLVVAANNFEAVITELSVFAIEGHIANYGPFETCVEPGCVRRRELLAKIEREAGEK